MKRRLRVHFYDGHHDYCAVFAAVWVGIVRQFPEYRPGVRDVYSREPDDITCRACKTAMANAVTAALVRPYLAGLAS